MLEKINQPIEVLVRFAGTTVLPLSFVWQGRVYDDLKLNLVHSLGAGADRIHYFSLSDGANAFRLAFHTRELSWTLEELYYDS